jgi:hypothetical protein
LWPADGEAFMRQFGHYPIYINYADHWEDVRQRQIREFAAPA